MIKHRLALWICWGFLRTQDAMTKPNETPDKLKEMAEDARAKAARLPPGPERDALLKEARRLDMATHLDEWASSPGLRPPTS